MVPRNHFFLLYQKDESSDSKVKLRHASNRWKRVNCLSILKLPNLHMLIKQKSPLLPRNLALGNFCELLIVFPAKVNLLYFLVNGLEVLSSASDKAKLFAGNVSKNSNLDD